MAAFPTLATGSVAMYPVTRTHTRQTRVFKFLDDKEQRYRDRVRLERFELVFEHLGLADRDTIISFFDSTKGSFDATWEISLAGVTYKSCVFEDDELKWSEPIEGLYNLTLKIRQTKRV